MKICNGFIRSVWHFPSKCGSLGVEATDIFCCATIKQQLWNQEFLLAQLDANVKRLAGLFHIPHSQNRGWWAFAVLRTLINTCCHMMSCNNIHALLHLLFHWSFLYSYSASTVNIICRNVANLCCAVLYPRYATVPSAWAHTSHWIYPISILVTISSASQRIHSL